MIYKQMKLQNFHIKGAWEGQSGWKSKGYGTWLAEVFVQWWSLLPMAAIGKKAHNSFKFMCLGLYKVRCRGIGVNMYALFELFSQRLCNLVQQTFLRVDCHYVPTFKTFICKENCGPWAMVGIWSKLISKREHQDFHPQKTRENPVTNMTL